MRDLPVDADHLVLFPYPNQTPEEAFGRADVVWVGGGSVANLLALWRVHGVDDAARDAWERGVVLGGVSAGSICWHVGGTTDSFGPDLRIVTGGPRPDPLRQRRALRLRGAAPTAAAAPRRASSAAAVVLHRRPRRDPVRGHRAGAGAHRPRYDPATGPAAYRVERTADGGVVETRLAPGALDCTRPTSPQARHTAVAG